MKNKFSLAVHGGAYLSSGDYSAQKAQITQLLEIGQKMLARGESALDTVTECVRQMENAGLYIAGKGASANDLGEYELDASIMDGETRNAGGVISVSRVQNPILLARRIMEKNPHIYLSCMGAERFATEQGIELLEDPENYFIPAVPEDEAIESRFRQHGTVGAVACDAQGRLASATSTGGLPGKLAGRVGDTPIIGAGTYADGRMAVSCTGQGEMFIRAVAAKTACAFYEAGLPAEQALVKVLQDVHGNLRGWGGMIAVTRDGFAGGNYKDGGSLGMHGGTVTSDRDPALFCPEND